MPLIHRSSSNLSIVFFLVTVTQIHSFFGRFGVVFCLFEEERKKKLTNILFLHYVLIFCLIIQEDYSFIQKKIGVKDWIRLLQWRKSFEIIQICYNIKIFFCEHAYRRKNSLSLVTVQFSYFPFPTSFGTVVAPHPLGPTWIRTKRWAWFQISQF